MNCVAGNLEDTVLIEVTEFLYQLLVVGLQGVVEFICHCGRGRALLRLVMKHVKTCT